MTMLLLIYCCVGMLPVKRGISVCRLMSIPLPYQQVKRARICRAFIFVHGIKRWIWTNFNRAGNNLC